MTVAIIGIITSIGIVGYGKMINNVRKSVAWDKAEILNLGLKKYSQIVHDMPTAADADSTEDEFLVLRSLQWRDSDNISIGAPYARVDYNPVESNSVDDYRIRWNGFVFEVLNPGAAGLGFKVCDDGSDITTPVTFADDYAPQ